MSDVDPGAAPTPPRWSVEANEADSAEQHRDLLTDPSGTDPETAVGRSDVPLPLDEADAADVVEQGIEVDQDDEFDHD
jgi:hypothetical protein